jgi:hypothetical protein
LSRNILSPSCLMKDGYSFAKTMVVWSLRIIWFVACASIVNGSFVLNLDDLPICNISAKRSWPNDLSPTYIWHCRLGHISEKRMKKLHNDWLLTSFDFECYETCEACLLGKWPRCLSQVFLREPQTYWNSYIQMFVDQWVRQLEVDTNTS